MERKGDMEKTTPPHTHIYTHTSPLCISLNRRHAGEPALPCVHVPFSTEDVLREKDRVEKEKRGKRPHPHTRAHMHTHSLYSFLYTDDTGANLRSRVSRLHRGCRSGKKNELKTEKKYNDPPTHTHTSPSFISLHRRHADEPAPPCVDVPFSTEDALREKERVEKRRN